MIYLNFFVFQFGLDLHVGFMTHGLLRLHAKDRYERLCRIDY